MVNKSAASAAGPAESHRRQTFDWRGGVQLGASGDRPQSKSRRQEGACT